MSAFKRAVRGSRLIAWSFVVLLTACRANTSREDENWQPPPLAPPPPGAHAEAVEWSRTHSTALTALEPGSGFADLRALQAAIGGARVIGFGEGMHDTHEFLTLRNRLFELLVSESGVTAIGLETGATEALAADDYVLGKAEASRAAYTSVFSWADEPSRENKQLLDWMRAYNDRPTTTRKLRVYGLDLSGGRSGAFTHARLAPDAMMNFIDAVDPALSRRLRPVFDRTLTKFNTASYASLPARSRDALTAAIADAVGAFEREQVVWIERSSAFDYSRAYGQALVARQIDMGMRNDSDVQEQRDAAMAHNAIRALNEQGRDGRLMVFAYSGHIRGGPTATVAEAFGVYLRRMLGKDYFIVGSTFNEGAVGAAGRDEWPMPHSDSTTLNVALREGAGRDMFYVDTRHFPAVGPLAQWLDAGEPMRSNYWEGSPRTSFDVLIHVDKISPMHVLE